MPSVPRTIGRRAGSPKPAALDLRESSARRGYSYRWQKYAKQFLAANPLCKHCEQAGRTTLAALVDHITPVTLGESDLNFWPSTNHQPLCRRCHARKTAADTKAGLTR